MVLVSSSRSDCVFCLDMCEVIVAVRNDLSEIKQPVIHHECSVSFLELLFIYYREGSDLGDSVSAICASEDIPAPPGLDTPSSGWILRKMSIVHCRDIQGIRSTYRTLVPALPA